MGCELINEPFASSCRYIQLGVNLFRLPLLSARGKWNGLRVSNGTLIFILKNFGMGSEFLNLESENSDQRESKKYKKYNAHGVRNIKNYNAHGFVNTQKNTTSTTKTSLNPWNNNNK